MKMNAKNVFATVMKNILYFSEALFVIVLGVFSVLLTNSIIWMFDTWTYLTMEELVYFLNSPMEGTSKEMIMEYVEFCVPGTVLALFLILVIMIVLQKTKWLYHIVMAGIAALSLGLAGYYVHMAWVRLDISGYSENQSTYSTFLEDNYIDPDSVRLEFPEQKRNLIYIYLESMETTFADIENGGAFAENYIPELTALAQENEDFSGSEQTLNGGYSMPHTTWTVAGMFAQTSGLPLAIPLDNNDMNIQDSFFLEITTMGDILRQAGYSQTLLIGSDATFGGRRLLFSGHGDFTIHDYNYAAEEGLIPEGYRVWWGYEDKRLFDFAKRELRTLSQQEEPFNLTLLTVDTHKEDGYVCKDCRTRFGDDQYGNVVACSSKKVAQFVQWVQRQDFYDNTTIVIAGDHPTMDSDFCKDVGTDYTRKVYTAYINPAAETQQPDLRREYTTYDHFPTTLASLGVEIEGNRLGLGTNLFSDKLTLAEEHQRGPMERELSRKSRFMEDLTADLKEAPEAAIVLQDYNRRKREQPILITDIRNIEQKVVSLSVAVWTETDQSDLRWFFPEENEDGGYEMAIRIADFGYKSAKYQIHVYATLEDGQMILLEGIEYTIK